MLGQPQIIMQLPNNKYKKGYTLIELLVAMVIIAMMTALGLPAYARYGNMNNFTQKTEEIKNLMNYAYLASQNPGTDTTVKQYEIIIDTSSSPKAILQSCTTLDISGAACTSPTVVKTVALTDGESWVTSDSLNVYLRCSTNKGMVCNSSPTGVGVKPFQFKDTNLNPAKSAYFNITANPFKVTTTTETVN